VRIAYIIFTILITLTHPVIAEDLKITQRQHAMIEELEAYLDTPFPEFFADLSGHLEICGNKLDQLYCKAPLRKYTNDISLIVRGADTLRRDGRFDHAIDALTKAINQLSKVTGLKITPTRDYMANSAKYYIYFTYFAPEIFHQDPQGFIDKFVAGKNLPTRTYIIKNFELFLERKIPCYALIFFDEIHGTFASHIWVREDLSDHEIAKCTFEELYNAYGLSEFDSTVSAVTDWPFIWNAEHERYTDFALFLMQILYSDHMKVGQDRSTTMREIKRIIETK